MNTAAALNAARRLSVDVANLSYRLALAEATQDLLRETLFWTDSSGNLCKTVDPEMWQRRMVNVGGPVNETRAEIILTQEQADAVTAIIATLEQLL